MIRCFLIGQGTDFIVLGGGVSKPDVTNASARVIPEPSGILLLGGLCCLLLATRRKC